MPNKVTLYPIYAFSQQWDAQPFDMSVLPFGIVEYVMVEDVRSMFTDKTFAWVQRKLGEDDVKTLQDVKYAIVHRYSTDDRSDGSDDDRVSENLVRNLVACLRLIRPTRQRTSLMRGELTPEGKIDVRYFENPREIMEVPDVQKLFTLRNADLVELRNIASAFLTAMGNEIWKFKMAVEFHEAGYFQDWYWKARYSLWCSALESLYTSQTHGNKGSLVAKERIKWFLNESTSIYDPGDIPNFVIPQPNICVGDVVDDLYKVRNLIAHGDRVPAQFHQRKMRNGIQDPLSVLEVLLEALSFIIRKSLLRILRDNLQPHFAGTAASDSYFGKAGLALDAIRKRKSQP